MECCGPCLHMLRDPHPVFNQFKHLGGSRTRLLKQIARTFCGDMLGKTLIDKVTLCKFTVKGKLISMPELSLKLIFLAISVAPLTIQTPHHPDSSCPPFCVKHSEGNLAPLPLPHLPCPPPAAVLFTASAWASLKLPWPPWLQLPFWPGGACMLTGVAVGGRCLAGVSCFLAGDTLALLCRVTAAFLSGLLTTLMLPLSLN